MPIQTPLTLPCGAQLSNRIIKAAMSEQLARPDHQPGRGLCQLYRRWGQGGAGALITGNVMVDPTHLESKKNVVLTHQSDLSSFSKWAASSSPTPLWMQLNHPGRQCPRYINPRPMAPSEVDAVKLFRRANAFGRPRGMTGPEIDAVIKQFGDAAALAREAGFAGVQVHGAHGYLISQFLSPMLNLRQDAWGGDLKNRSRLLREIIRCIRRQAGDDFALSVKLNSADFQLGGFSEEDSLSTLHMLEKERVDLVEISGGNYEASAMFDLTTSTSRREAYFLEFARRARAQISLPLMVTGGFRSADVMRAAITSGALDVVGMARPFANNPDVAKQLIEGHRLSAESSVKIPWLFKTATISEAMLSVAQMAVISRGYEPNGKLGPWLAVSRGLILNQLRRR